MRIAKPDVALELAKRYGNKEIPDNEALAVLMEYRAALIEQGDSRSLLRVLPYLEGTKRISGRNITGLLWNCDLARSGMRVI